MLISLKIVAILTFLIFVQTLSVLRVIYSRFYLTNKHIS